MNQLNNLGSRASVDCPRPPRIPHPNFSKSQAPGLVSLIDGSHCRWSPGVVGHSSLSRRERANHLQCATLLLLLLQHQNKTSVPPPPWCIRKPHKKRGRCIYQGSKFHRMDFLCAVERKTNKKQNIRKRLVVAFPISRPAPEGKPPSQTRWMSRCTRPAARCRRSLPCPQPWTEPSAPCKLRGSGGHAGAALRPAEQATEDIALTAYLPWP